MNKIRNFVKRLSFFPILAVLMTSNFSSAEELRLTASEVMLRVDERYTGHTQSSTGTLVLIDKQDRQRSKSIKMFQLEAENVEKSIMFFIAPADIQGTSYLTFDWKAQEKDDDSWLYLPALGKIKRIAATDESGSFMGSDFSFSDINGGDYEDYDYLMLKESEDIQGYDCWVIESKPKNERIIKKTGYLKAVSWVRKDIFMTIQSVINVKKGLRTKYYSTNDIEKIDGIWTAKTLQMITTKNNKKEHSSIFKLNDISYDKNVDEKIFDTQAMQRGL